MLRQTQKNTKVSKAFALSIIFGVYEKKLKSTLRIWEAAARDTPNPIASKLFAGLVENSVYKKLASKIALLKMKVHQSQSEIQGIPHDYVESTLNDYKHALLRSVFKTSKVGEQDAFRQWKLLYNKEIENNKKAKVNTMLELLAKGLGEEARFVLTPPVSSESKETILSKAIINFCKNLHKTLHLGFSKWSRARQDPIKVPKVQQKLFELKRFVFLYFGKFPQNAMTSALLA